MSSAAGQEVLEIVEDEQHALVPQVFSDDVAHIAAGHFGEAEGTGDGRKDKRGVGERAERHREHAMREVVKELRGRSEREARLSDAAGADEGDELDVITDHQRSELGELALPPNGLGPQRRQVVRAALETPQRRELGDQIGVDELEELLWTLKILQPMRAQVVEHDLGVRAIDELSGREREHDLPTMRCGHDPRAAIQRRAEVMSTPHLDRTGMEAHPHSKGAGLRPDLGAKGALAVDRGTHRGDRVAERGVHRVADGLEDNAAGTLDRGGEELVVPRDRRGVGARMGLEQPGARFDVGEEEGHRAGGQVWALPILRRGVHERMLRARPARTYRG